MLAIIQPTGMSTLREGVLYTLKIQGVTYLQWTSATNLIHYLIDSVNEEQYYGTEQDTIIWYQFEDYELRSIGFREAMYIAEHLDKGNIPTICDLEKLRRDMAADFCKGNAVIPLNSHNRNPL